MPCGFVVLEPGNCFALFYFVVNVCISHVIIKLMRYFLISKSRDLVSHNPEISGLKNGPGLQSLVTMVCAVRTYTHC